jgi:putative hydrolase of the HAD superfamily
MLDLTKIRAITLDLDDTLWPIWPTIERAEKALQHWLLDHAPRTSALLSDPTARLALRHEVMAAQPEMHHHSAQRLELIRLALERSGDNTALAAPAFEVFFDERNRVTLFDDALQSLAFLSARFPLVALSNGNADLARVGLSTYFQGGLAAQEFGVAKPDRRIFEAAATLAGTLPAHVLHIGDDAELDVLGALGCGMQTVWVNREDKLWPHAQEPHETVTTLSELTALFTP